MKVPSCTHIYFVFNIYWQFNKKRIILTTICFCLELSIISYLENYYFEAKKKKNILYVDDDDKNWKENKIYLKNVNKMDFIRNDDYCIGIDKKKKGTEQNRTRQETKPNNWQTWVDSLLLVFIIFMLKDFVCHQSTL